MILPIIPDHYFIFAILFMQLRGLQGNEVLPKVMTLNAEVIIVCFMFNSKSNDERNNHDTQRFYKKNIDHLIAEYVDVKSYA